MRLYTHTHTHTSSFIEKEENKKLWNKSQSVLSKTDGITLVALVVTIVVLLILAGITLTYVFGDNSVFNQASEAKIQTELGKIEERAQVIYSDKLLENVSSTLSTKVETSKVIEQLKSEGCTIEKRPVKEGDITGISLDKESMTIGHNRTVEINVTYEGVDDPFVYYVEVQGKYYQMHSNKGFITIDREASTLTKADFENGGEESTATLTITTNPTDIITASLKGKSNKIIEVTSTTKEGEAVITVTYGSYEKTCKVKVVEPVLATSITLNETEYVVTGGDSWTNDLQLVATLEPSNVTEKEVTWKSDNPEIATVDEKGLVKAGTKGGDVTITATTKDGTNLSKTCKITTELFGKINTAKTAYTDSDGNTAQIPDGFAVGTSDNINRVMQGLVIQDDKGNQFVWIPIGEIKKANGEKDNIILGRYTFNKTNGTPKLDQNADNYNDTVTIDSYYQELMIGNGNSAAKSLKNFVAYSKSNGGYYLARYEASQEKGDTPKFRFNEAPWRNISQPNAAQYSQHMYQKSNMWSDLANSYAYDTAIVFIQMCSENSNYINTGLISGFSNTGRLGDKVCNIYDMLSNSYEWSTEYSTRVLSSGTTLPCVIRGPVHNSSLGSFRQSSKTTDSALLPSFRVILYLI